jgi:two-component system chemotaxis response regulator CheY
MRQTVLAIDDSPTFREMIDFILSGAGYDVVLAEDGIEGLACLAACAPHVVITDLNMPRLNGLGFIERARATAPGKSVPIIVLTTESNAEKKVHAKSVGASDWMMKPFDPGQLVQTVKRFLDISADPRRVTQLGA